uniref:Germin-like protein n=4 Tax=Triticinae TaxID=1648030 RepID=A0A452XPR2_AEGTS
SDSMAYNSYPLLLVLLALSAPLAVFAGDPDILADFVIPASTNPTNITGDYFTYTGFRDISTPAYGFTLTKATMMEFPALNGQSVSYAMLTFPPGSVNPTHTHPRASELLIVAHGTLSVGFIDTANRLYTQDLGPGDMFVFPKGTVHYQFNQGNSTATALSAFGSATPGLVSVPLAVFDTGIDNTVLAKSFKTDEATIQKLKAGLAFRCC